MIDWKAQWEAHGHNYRDGHVHVNLAKFGKNQEIKLIPGPGFGDLSHPTTRLVMRMMAPHVKGKHVLDIGCGSGVLALTAAALGAASVYGIDIDPGAVEHAKINAELNQLESIVQFGLPGSFSSRSQDLIILMNMIRTEQVQAWDPSLSGKIFTSGVLKEEKALYEEQCRQWGWDIVDIWEEEGWLGLFAKKA